MSAREWVLLDSDGREGNAAATFRGDGWTAYAYPAGDGMGGLNWGVEVLRWRDDESHEHYDTESTQDWPAIEAVLPRSEWPSRVFAGQKYEGKHRASDALEAHMVQIEARYAKELAMSDRPATPNLDAERGVHENIQGVLQLMGRYGTPQMRNDPDGLVGSVLACFGISWRDLQAERAALAQWKAAGGRDE